MAISGLFPGSSAGAALEILAAAGLAEEPAVFHDHFAAGEHGAGVAADRKAFEHGIVHAHVMGLRTDGVERGGIPDDDVGVAAGSDLALPGIHAEDARGGSG